MNGKCDLIIIFFVLMCFYQAIFCTISFILRTTQGIPLLIWKTEKPMTEDIVSDITEALESGKELEGLVRDILRILEVVSGKESTYLTRFEDEHETLRLLFTHNAGEMLLPEGIAESSGDTLCERSLQEGVRFAPDANLRWSDCPSIERYDIVSYLSAPVLLSDGSVYGTLCAVSHESHELSGSADKLLTLFSRLISFPQRSGA